MTPALAFPAPDPLIEASGDDTARRAQRANRAAQDVLKDRWRLERDASGKLTKRLDLLKGALSDRLIAGDVSITDFKRFDLAARLRDVDQMIGATQAGIIADASTDYKGMVTLGEFAADQPLKAAQLTIKPALPGLDRILVDAAFDNTVDLLTTPMQQFGTDVKVALRGVALAGDNRFDAIQKLRDRIAGAGFDNAQYRAERIIRTELGRVFNEATYARLVEQAKDFPFLRKGWRAVNDIRTRKGHTDAARNYTRGSGIPIAVDFAIDVYQVRTKKGVVVGETFLGTVNMRFPLDPNATPAGKLAASATIMCRCNAFVDFSLDDFADYSRSQVQLALGKLPARPGPVPVPGLPRAPLPVDPTELAKRTTFRGGRFYFGSQADAQDVLTGLGGQGGSIVKTKFGWSIKQTGTRAFYGPQGWTAPAARVPKAGAKATPPAIVHEPKAALPFGPGEGAKVSTALAVPNGPKMATVRRALDLLDGVHSDGDLPRIPVKASASRRQLGAYVYGGHSGKPVEIRINGGALANKPYNTILHEIGHFLDHQGLAKFDVNQGGYYTGRYTTPSAKVLDDWREVVKASETYQTLATWKQSIISRGGAVDNIAPKGASAAHLNYLMSTIETWARAYAQYVVTRSGDPAALAELRTLQKAATVGHVPADRPFNMNPTGKAPIPGSWDYPTVWQDKEFEPIAAAFDRLFEQLGWRRKAGK